MNIALIAGVATPITLDGQWIYIESSAAGKVEIYRENTGERVSLKQSSVYTAEKGALGRIHLTASESGNVSIETGFGTFTPPVEGQSVVIKSQPKMQLADNQQIKVKSLPAVKIAANQQVRVFAMPAVTIASNQQVGVYSLPAVEFAGGQFVGINQLPKIQIDANQSLAVSALPKVELAASQSLALAAPIEVAAGQKIEITTAQTLATQSVLDTGLTIGGGALPQTIAANATRSKITLKAAKANTQTVLIGTYPLDAGETITLDTTAQIELTGLATDNIHFIEVTQ